VNIDTINSKYLLVNILTKDIEAEMAKQEAIFANRQKSFQSKYEQFQKNYQANVLTPVQVENTQAQLMKESETLQADYEKVFGDLQARENAALKQISDSLITITKRINAKRNASFIFSYQAGGQLISADPTKDITDEVLFELNKPFKK
ncbi:MAG: OmpH family outer membrane protein, partial [Bacteroidales bacterium]